jgi:hypothetical protein
MRRKSKRRQEKRGEPPNFPERMAKTAQILSNLNENLFDFFDFAVKKKILWVKFSCKARFLRLKPQKCTQIFKIFVWQIAAGYSGEHQTALSVL